MSTQQNDYWAEEQKQQIMTAVLDHDYNRADKLNQELIDVMGYGVDYDDLRDEDPNYEE